MSIETLRALVLNHKPETSFTLVLERDRMDAIYALQDRISELRDPETEVPVKGISEDPEKKRTKLIEAAESELAAAYEAARDVSLVLIFRRLPAAGEGSYQELHDGVSKNGYVRASDLYRELMQASYVRAETADGEDVGLSIDDVWQTISNGDMEAIGDHLLEHNRRGQTIPFDPRPSGLPATS